MPGYKPMCTYTSTDLDTYH